MWNILLDPLPEQWNGFPIDTDFQTGIQITQCLGDPDLNARERLFTALELLFPDEENRPLLDDAQEALGWYLTAFDQDKHTQKKSEKKLMDFDTDQWRIYAAFLSQYGIDLNTARMHWFVFMGLLSNLEESSFIRVIDIRQKEIDSKMSPEERRKLREAKKVYGLEKVESLSEEEKVENKEALEEFNRLRNAK